MEENRFFIFIFGFLKFKRNLKIWKWKPNKNSFSLNSRFSSLFFPCVNYLKKNPNPSLYRPNSTNKGWRFILNQSHAFHLSHTALERKEHIFAFGEFDLDMEYSMLEFVRAMWQKERKGGPRKGPREARHWESTFMRGGVAAGSGRLGSATVRFRK